MELTRVITGGVMTEKAERMKSVRIYTLRVHPDASKIDVKNALRKHYGVEAKAVRMMKIRAKRRELGGGRHIQKRNPEKRALVTLTQKSKILDLSSLSS